PPEFDDGLQQRVMNLRILDAALHHETVLAPAEQTCTRNKPEGIGIELLSDRNRVVGVHGWAVERYPRSNRSGSCLRARHGSDRGTAAGNDSRFMAQELGGGLRSGDQAGCCR